MNVAHDGLHGPGGTPLSPEVFTRTCAEAFRARDLSLQVVTVGPLELRLQHPGAADHTLFLQNAYDQYRRCPGKLLEIVGHHVSSSLEGLGLNAQPIDRGRIVPVVKDVGYLADVRRALRERGTVEADTQPVGERYNTQLDVLYAEDQPRSMRYLTRRDLQGLRLDLAGLRTLAVSNLRALLPPAQIQGGDGLFMINAGGNYESSLLLVDELWHNEALVVQGDLVVAVPARGLLIVTGDGEAMALELVRGIAHRAFHESPYRLTTTLFVYRHGRFEALDA